MVVHLVLPAAGRGDRFGAVVPKQYVPVLGKPLLSWTLAAFQGITAISQQVVVIAQGDQHIDAVLADFPAVACAQGGSTRAASVLRGLHALQRHAEAEDWVLVHDVVRPCIVPSDVNRLISHCVHQQQGALLARPVTDTIKRLAHDRVVETIDRKRLFSAQTPQCFKFNELKNALEYCAAQQIAVTDEAAAMEAVGKTVGVVEGSATNIKLTYPDDLALIEYYLTQRAL